ncbi:protein involved in polysaccharide export with SLBB domain [Dyadobacter sp. BE34]|uniref:Protein involved in polysaccharide export with SLBB domain n=1 Tax=Dyadobacter fermentans TaxID=94254 RepID=A0ABU1QSD3_9BACT|nr:MULTISPECIES: SLBB domain-containing protein [Dyadobacter]MDR6803574.1 protein involved in polysaccharide export with SLBB domain [Dyadobacter fermentans]MDR7041314.1 protein involved in polysaccharide export with SLBB domain [Dyadobacter sp. BE242]MDR7195718.1 protein involved in polysaccharide export with SLBB domain [Dyadobacter sp. BE34]MDR7213738.1 protein involved in polysaccharide export with SLBB domain [Dyadobacter sp. BE31]MDR7261124.1 protein involved in polysaccharide export wit
MHYQSFVRSCFRNTLLLLLLLTNIGVFAQNNTSPQLPTDPTQPKIDPSQVTNQQAVDFYNQAKSAGMSDMDIEKAALQRGYTLDQISTMRKRLQQKPDEKQTNDPNRDELDETRDQDDADQLEDEANNERDSTNARRARNRRLSRTFGSAFFSRTTSTFEPNLRIATPRNYILGPEDEIVVDIYGNAVDNFRMKISPEGTVKMLNLAPVYVNGLTIEQASERIVNRLRQAYSTLNRPGSGTYSSITLGNVRSIHVMITGEAARPGTYTVSSLATAFNALSISGGPSLNGSYRNIEVIRNNKIIRKIDLYKFLVDADLRDNIALQDQDIILIRPFETRIELNGQLKRPGIFEAKPGETLGNLIRYAGGFTPEAYTKTFTYQRNTGTNYMIGSIDSLQIETFAPKNGDIFNVKRILDIVANQVEIRGAVTLPGPYALEERCNSVLKLIQMAQGLSPRAFLNRAILERSSGETQTGIVAIDLRKLVNGEIADIPLLAGDILTIKSVEDLKEFTFLTISGSVINPGNYYYYKDITIADLIFQAGGYTEGGIPYRIEVSRRVKNDTLDLPSSQNVRIFSIDVADNLVLNPDDQKFKLQPQDIIVVRKSPRYEPQKSVTVIGEVRYPGNYTIINNFERISDLFGKVGGLRSEAYLPGARFYRGQELIAVDIEAIVNKPSLPSNLLLMHGDTLVIPRRLETVRIQGGVHNPSVMNFDSKFSYDDYISQAGGYTEQGWKKRVYVSYPNGRTHRTKNFLFFRSYPKVEPGAVVTVPVKVAEPDRQKTPGERIALFSFIASMVSTLTLAVITLSRNN